MKNVLFYALCFMLVILTSSCSKSPENVLPSKDGKWNLNGDASITISQTGSPSQTQTFQLSGIATFTETDVTMNGETYGWSATSDQVILTDKSDNSTVTYDILEKSNKKEVWKTDYTYSQSLGGITQSFHVVENLTLTR